MATLLNKAVKAARLAITVPILSCWQLIHKRNGEQNVLEFNVVAKVIVF